jgi:hypothetical protein
LVACISAARVGSTATTAAAWTTASQPSTAASTEERSVMSPVTISQPSMCMRSKSAVAFVGVRTITRTSCPSRRSARTVWLPRKPVAPVTEDLHGPTSTSL